MVNIRRNILIPIFDKIKKERRLEYLPEVVNRLEQPYEKILETQFKKLIQIVKYAYENIEYYKIIYNDIGLNINRVKNFDDFNKLPIITKDDVRKNKDKMLNKKLDRDRFIESGTSGTTQAPIKFYLDKDSYDRRLATTLYFFSWFGYQLGDKVACLWGAQQDFPEKESIKYRISNFLFDRWLMLPSSYLNDDVMMEYYKKIQKFKPKILQSYPTPLYLFSCFLEKYGLRLKIPFIEVTAERLYENQRKQIETVFERKIYNWYGAREIGHGATECQFHNGMHINCYGLYMEILNNGKRVNNEYGDIIVTDLFNKAMPFIRYKIGDIGKISTNRCKCGSNLPILKDVIGRHGDIFLKRDGTMVPGTSWSDEITEACTGIDQFQIIQKDYTIFKVNIVKNPSFTNSQLEYLKNSISTFMHEDLKFIINFVEEIPKENSGKILACKCEINKTIVDEQP